MGTILPDPVSLTTHHLHMCFTETNSVLGCGTGFTYQKDNATYLITNWHNVTARDPGTGKCLSETLAVPNMISTMFREVATPAACRREQLSLYNDSIMM